MFKEWRNSSVAVLIPFRLNYEFLLNSFVLVACCSLPWTFFCLFTIYDGELAMSSGQIISSGCFGKCNYHILRQSFNFSELYKRLVYSEYAMTLCVTLFLLKNAIIIYFVKVLTSPSLYKRLVRLTVSMRWPCITLFLLYIILCFFIGGNLNHNQGYKFCITCT